MKPSTILRGAAERLSTPECWARGDYAFDAAGNLAGPCSKEAVSWCSIGAIRVAGDRADGMARYDARGYLYRAVTSANDYDAADGDELIADWNDEDQRRHSDVLEKFRKAIELAEAAGR